MAKQLDFSRRSRATSLQRLLSDVENIDRLNSKGLASRLGLMLSGPPGTGKTFLAGHIAARLGRPFYVVRLDSVISSLLGDTAKNIRTVFDFVPSRNAVLFLDEMDAVAKLRDDRHELGELKRVVSTVIQGLDALDAHAVVIGATNHPHLLDLGDMAAVPIQNRAWAIRRRKCARICGAIFCLKTKMPTDSRISSQRYRPGLSGADIETIALTRAPPCVLGSRDLDLAAVAFAVVNTQKGRSSLPQKDPLTSDQKKQLAIALKEKGDTTVANIARLIHVTRQSIYLYLKEDEGGEHASGT